MARRRRRRRAVRTRRAAPKRRRSYRRSSSGVSRKELVGTAVGAMAYGALRDRVSAAISPVTSRFGGFLGTLADEAGMAAVSYFAMKSRMPFLKKVGKAGFAIEMARVGSGLSQGLGGGQRGTVLTATVL